MRLDDFDYELPPDRIAQSPTEPRDAARLLIDRGSAPPDDGGVGDLIEELRPGDLLVVNETKVLPARLELRRRTGGRAEVLLLEPVDGAHRRWEAMVRPAKKLGEGEVLLGADGTEVIRMGHRTAAGDTFIVELIDPEPTDPGVESVGGDWVEATLGRFGQMPLPPYIEARLADPNRYQTVFARLPGSAAAPTAGLHFTPELLEVIAARGVDRAHVELVVGLDTFRPVAADNPLEHKMHTERYQVPPATLAACEHTRSKGGRVVAVGTTAVRALESAVSRGELSGRTDLFIHRGYDWKLVDLLMTNFHLPKTTLLMMIDAFVGDRWRDLYQHALDSDGLVPPYRFLSFGDAMLLDRHAD